MNDTTFTRYATAHRGFVRFLLEIVIIIAIVFGVLPVLKHYDNTFLSARSITVSAEGKTFVSPDIAETSFGVVSRGQKPEELAATNHKKINAVIEFLKAQGIESKDIKTVNYNLQTEYDYTERERKIIGYMLTQTVAVKIRDINKVAAIVGGLTPLGINEVNSISFTVDDPDGYLEEARAEAFEKAREKARAMVSQNGARLGKILNISEYGGGPPIPYYYGKGGTMFETAADVAPPRIEPGTQEVRVSVTLTYELR